MGVLANLLYFQFAFVYLLAMIIGLVVYGSDFKGIAGWIYVVPLILLTIVHKRIWSYRFQISSGRGLKFICGLGVIVALLAYAPMHMGYWDEHSLSQAFLIAVLGLCSYLVGVAAATRLSEQKMPNKNSSALALGIIGLFWLLATQYPLAVLLCLTILFVIAVFWLAPLQETQGEKIDVRLRSDPFAKFAVLLVAIDISCVAWDFEVDTQWALYIAASFIAAAVGFYTGCSEKRSDQVEQTIYTAVVANFAIAAIWPAYVLWFLHVSVAGFCMGYLLPRAIYQAADQDEAQLTMGWTVWFFLGVVLSNAWYANLYWASSRLLMLLPFVILALLYLAFKYSASKYQN